MSRRAFRTYAGHPGHGVQGLLDAGPDLLRAGPAPGPYGAVGRPGQVEQMDPLGLVELQRGGQGVEDAFGDPAQVAPLEPDVVVDADPGEQGDLLPAEPGDAPVAPVRGQAGPIRADPGPPRAQELARLLPVVHTPEPTGAPAGVGGPVSTWVGGAAPAAKGHDQKGTSRRLHLPGGDLGDYRDRSARGEVATIGGSRGHAPARRWRPGRSIWPGHRLRHHCGSGDRVLRAASGGSRCWVRGVPSTRAKAAFSMV